MKDKNILITKFLYSIVLIVSVASCNSQVKFKENKNIKIVNKMTIESKTLPKSWPWHGVTLATHYHLNVDKDLRRIKKDEANFVTIYLKPRKIANFEKISPKKAFEESLNLADKILDKCKELGLYAMIYFSEMPIDPSKNITQSSKEFWESEEERSKALNLIETVIKRFKTRGDELQAYQFFGEPVSVGKDKKAKTPKKWDALFKEIYHYIKINDSNRFLVYAPGPWGGPRGFKNLEPIVNDPKVLYSLHYYLPHKYSHQGIRKFTKSYEYPGYIGLKYWDKSTLRTSLNDVITFQNKYNKLIYVGEFSANYKAEGWEYYLKDLIDFFNENNFAYTYFTYNGYKAWAINNFSKTSISKKQIGGKFNLEERGKRYNLLKQFWQLKKDSLK